MIGKEEMTIKIYTFGESSFSEGETNLSGGVTYVV
jgi:hypothetical protein